MKLLLDSSVLLSSFFYPASNSRTIFDLVASGKLEGVVSEKAILEVKGVLSYRKGPKVVYLVEKSLWDILKVVPVAQVSAEAKHWSGKIKEKDLEHLATAKSLKLDYIVAFDRDFEPFKEYYTPKKFVEEVLKMRAFETQY